MEPTDIDLLRKAKAGESAAFRHLMDRHAAAILRLASNLVPNHHDAEDVLQETFIAAFRSMKAFEERSSVKTWLYAIAYRQAALLRRKKRMPMQMLTDDALLAGPEMKHELAVDAKIDLDKALAHLPEDHRAILILRELEGMSYEEIAGILELPRGTVESRLHRARQSLKNYFQPGMGR